MWIKQGLDGSRFESFQLLYGPGVAASDRNEYQKSSWGERLPGPKAGNLTAICESIV
jgi:hypothetical protein